MIEDNLQNLVFINDECPFKTEGAFVVSIDN
jgi:hypothetical protein